ncbi:methyltransferase domain-containing protein [Campylobacter fetus]|nr:methyltransferase domain-containing protein [Campylobacter fetus]
MSEKPYKTDICRLCGEKMQEVVQLSPSPIGDIFKDTKKEAAKLTICEYNLLHCKQCNNVQISIDPTSNIYKDYIYISSTSVDLQNHYKALSGKLVNELKKEHAFIVEFGSNEGLLLELINEELTRTSMGGGITKTWEILGIDPSPMAAKMANQKGIPTINDYFNQDLAKKISLEKGKADLIVANFVMANISDMYSIAKSINELLDKDGVFVFETGYLCDILRFNLIDTIYPEHLNYYSLSSLKKYLEKFGLRIFRAENTTAKGGALRVWVCKNEAKIVLENSVQIIMDMENNFFSNQNIFKDFLNRLSKFKVEVKNLAKQIKDKEKLLVYGASIGCIVMIEQFELGEKIDYLIDDNELKIGKFSPSRAIEVKSSEFLLQSGVKNVINLAWRFCEPIKQKNKKFLENGGTIYNINLKNLKIDKV